MDKWIKKDLKYIWHPYTQMKDCRKYPPILVDKARGVKLYDHKGNFYYDTISSWWCNVHGHNHPKIKNAVKKQLDSLEHVLFAGFTHKGAVLLAQKIVSLAPDNLSKVFYSDNGSTSVEVALKMSFQYWQNIGRKNKTAFLSLDHAYHGDTIGAMSVGGVDLFNKVFSPLFFPAFKAPSPYCYRCPAGKLRSVCDIECIRPLEAILKRNHSKIAAVILEPLVLAAGGMIIYPPQYLEKASRLTKKYGVHLILDEVATGFGRTGKMFAYQHAAVEADFICLSKGITSGYLPLAMTLTTDEVYRAFYADYEKKKTFFHGHTYTANPLACAAGLASLKVFEEEDTLDKMKGAVEFLGQGLDEFRCLPYVGDTRHLGLIGAIELVKNKKSKEEFGLKERVGLKVYQAGLRRNIILRPLGSVVYLYLPLSIKKSEIKIILEKTAEVLKGIK
ncbi:MAG: adenosylmethionine--8-amino-7-oxononanoate transaminase [Candidatus Omnitrophica bacterium]|nr:adenosylmethionine--8-amino-7-oxononanoate transaminase [Candidatus Omnitrophota bacterium]